MNRVRAIDAAGIHRHFCIIHLLDGCCQAGCLLQRNHSRAGALPVRRRSALAGSSVLHYRSIFIHLHFWCSLWLKKQGSAIWDHIASLNQLSQYWYESFIYHLTLYFFKGMVLIVTDQRVSVSHALIARTWRFMTHVFISIPWSHSPHASWRSL